MLLDFNLQLFADSDPWYYNEDDAEDSVNASATTDTLTNGMVIKTVENIRISHGSSSQGQTYTKETITRYTVTPVTINGVKFIIQWEHRSYVIGSGGFTLARFPSRVLSSANLGKYLTASVNGVSQQYERADDGHYQYWNIDYVPNGSGNYYFYGIYGGHSSVALYQELTRRVNQNVLIKVTW